MDDYFNHLVLHNSFIKVKLLVCYYLSLDSAMKTAKRVVLFSKKYNINNLAFTLRLPCFGNFVAILL